MSTETEPVVATQEHIDELMTEAMQMFADLTPMLLFGFDLEDADGKAAGLTETLLASLAGDGMIVTSEQIANATITAWETVMTRWASEDLSGRLMAGIARLTPDILVDTAPPECNRQSVERFVRLVTRPDSLVA